MSWRCVLALISVVAADAAQAETSQGVAIVDTREDEESAAGERLAAALRANVLVVPRVLAVEGAPTLRAARQHLAGAQDALTRFRDDDALVKVAKAEKALAGVHDDDRVRDLLVRLNWVAAQAHAALGKSARADDACRLAHRLNPSRRLPKAELPPAMVSRCQRAISQRIGRATLTVGSTPANAEIRFNLGPKAAATSKELEIGEHYVGVQAPGRLAEFRRVAVGSAGAKLSFSLVASSPARQLGSLLDQARSRRTQWGAVARIAAGFSDAVLVVFVVPGERFSIYDRSGRRLAEGTDTVTAKARIDAFVSSASNPMPGERQPATGVAATHDHKLSKSSSWYQNPWIWIGVAAVAGVITYTLVSSDGDQYVTGEWTLQ